METKTCCTCKETKTVSEFNKDKNTKDGYAWRCRDCAKASYRIHYHKVGGMRWRHIERKYGITKDEWLELFSKQGGICACCGADNPGSTQGWHTDHCHETGVVRGILCLHCNRGLGYLKSPEQCFQGAEYLRKHQQKQRKESQ